MTLEIGQLAGVMPEAIAFCFDEVARRAPLVEGASLEIREIDGARALRGCAARNSPRPDLCAACACGSRRFAAVAGEELKVKAWSWRRRA